MNTRRIVDAPGLHHWTPVELAELFYDALMRDARSEGYTAHQMRSMAQPAGDSAALAHLLSGPRTQSRR